MVALQRNWTCSWNNVPSQATLLDQAREVLLAFKNAYKGAGWTVEGSSDGTTAGMDATDRWSTVTDLTWDTAGNAHSWIVIRSPVNYPSTGKGIWLMLSCSPTVATQYHNVRITPASAAFTGGSTTADPTAPANAYTGLGTSGVVQFLNSSLTNSKYHYIYNTVGDVLCLVSQQASGYCATAWASLQSIGAEAADPYPWFGYFGYLVSGVGAFDALGVYTTTRHIMFWADDTVLTGANTCGFLRYLDGTAEALIYFDALGSDISGQYPALPAIIFSRVTSKVALRGTLVDITQAPQHSGIVQGTVEPATGTPTTAIVGDFWVPCGGVVPDFT